MKGMEEEEEEEEEEEGVEDDDRATRGCHVIMADQSPQTSVRYIIYCCPSCNGNNTGTPFDVGRLKQCTILMASDDEHKSSTACSHGVDG